MAEVSGDVFRAMYKRGGPLTYRLLLQSAVFIVQGLGLLVALSVAVHFEIARLLLAISVAGICLMAEVFVLARIAQRLWHWSDNVASTILRLGTSTVRDLQTETEKRGEA